MPVGHGGRAARGSEPAVGRDELERLVAERTSALSATSRELEAFVYAVSHDLRAPLRAISGFSQILLEQHAEQLDAQGQELLGRVSRASLRMGYLIDDLLGLSRLAGRELRSEHVSLSALAESVLAELHEREPDRAVHTVVQPGIAAVGDEGLLRVALMNLLGNAWKFTSKRQDPEIFFSNGGGVYRVSDNGAGFDMADAQRLFGAFQRLHPADEFEGTGIGLATVQRVVNLHRGRIWAESSPGGGATFLFTLEGDSWGGAASDV